MILEPTTLLSDDDFQFGTVAFAPDSKTIVASGLFRGSIHETHIPLWSVPGWKRRRDFKKATGTQVAFSSDSRRLALADSRLSVWEVSTRRRLMELGVPGKRIFSLCLFPDGRRLACGSEDGAITIWDLIGQKVIAVLKANEISKSKRMIDARVRSLSLSPNGKLLLSCDSKGIRLWDTKKYGAVQEWTCPKAVSISFLKDSVTFVCAASRTTVWRVGQTEPIRDLGKANAGDFMSLSPSERVFAAPEGKGSLRLWDLQSGDQVAHLGTTAKFPPTCVVFSPDERFLAAVFLQSFVAIWSLDDLLDGNINSSHTLKRSEE